MNIAMSIAVLEKLRAEMQALHDRLLAADPSSAEFVMLTEAVADLGLKWNKQLAALTLVMLPSDEQTH